MFLLGFCDNSYDASITRCCEGNSAGVRCFLMRASVIFYASVCTCFNSHAMSVRVRVLLRFMLVCIVSFAIHVRIMWGLSVLLGSA